MNFSSKKLICCFSLIFAAALLTNRASAQEINATVTVDRSQISGTSLGYLDNFPGELETYINEYDWINPNFLEEERVAVDLQITLLEVDNNYNFEAQLIIRSRRPIYNTTRETVLFLYSDDNWHFNYMPNRTLIHDELQFDPLTSVIDFYMHVVLGFDFDSFGQLGGTPYYRDAQNIVSLAQSTASQGWSGQNRQNRAQLISDLRSTSYEPFRLAIYQYHRLGLDNFLNNPQEARQQVLESLQKIQEARRNTLNDLLFDIFFNAKYREIVSVFEDADPEMKLEVYNLLSNIDQSHLSEYRKLQ